jgi:tRNA dimethylallyltransferase
MLSSRVKKRNSWRRIPALVGPTGIGKSEIAYHLALRLKAEILSADAFQIYRGMEIGTAQPPLAWRKSILHHLIGERSPDQPWNAVDFASRARSIIDEKINAEKKLIIVGGAGFYLKTLVDGAPMGAAPRPKTRQWVADQIDGPGRERAFSWLQERDPAVARRIHPNDLKRVRRALEKTYDRDLFSESFDPLGPENVLFLGLERSRENLIQLLRNRAEKIWDSGLIDETRQLIKLNLPSTHPIWAAIGYGEALEFMKGNMNKQEALERISIRSRQYAKRQYTWFRHQHEVHWVNLDLFPDFDTSVSEVEKLIKKLIRGEK